MDVDRRILKPKGHLRRCFHFFYLKKQRRHSMVGFVYTVLAEALYCRPHFVSLRFLANSTLAVLLSMSNRPIVRRSVEPVMFNNTTNKWSPRTFVVCSTGRAFLGGEASKRGCPGCGAPRGAGPSLVHRPYAPLPLPTHLFLCFVAINRFRFIVCYGSSGRFPLDEWTR